MHGSVSPLFLADLAIPSARQCLMVAVPILILIGARWMIAHTDQVVAKLFPAWEWEKRLGWLNIRAERRADAILRGIGHIAHALLAVALYGIAWGASFFAFLCQTNDPDAVATGMWKLSTLLLCLGVWVLYLGWELIPKLRDEFEREELEKYRVELAEQEEEHVHPMKPAARLAATNLSSWKKPLPSSQLGRKR